MASATAQGPLEVTLRTHNFPQSGSWSMLDIAKLPVQHAVAMLSRYAAGRVNPYTALVGEAIGLTFRMGRQGRLNIENALSKLSAVNTLGNALEIGFGIEDLTRTMARSEGGAMQLGLCAALKECFSDDIAIEVLLEYARATKADSQWMPSNLEWRNLLEACAGALAASTFSLRAEHFMGLAKGEPRLSTYGSHNATPEVARGCSAPKSIAEALLALSKLSLDQMDSVTIRGDPNAGWIAAIAEWFLDLQVMIVDESTGEILYTNHTNHKQTQVRVVYSSKSKGSGSVCHQTLPLPSSTSSSGANILSLKKKRKYELQAVHVTDRTYLVALENATSQLLLENREYNAHVVSGRVEWKKAFRSTFMSDFDHLMRVSEIFGSMIGSAARIFLALAIADNTISTDYFGLCGSYCDAAFGSGFVANAISWFPELAKLRSSMERAARESFEDARKEYVKCISSLRSHCNCSTCQFDRNGFAFDDKDSEQRDGKSDSASDDGDDNGVSNLEDTDDWDPNRYCHIIIAEAVIVICRLLSNLTICGETLLPMRSGMELAYARQLDIRRSAHLERKAIEDLGPILFCMAFNNDLSIATQGGNGEGIDSRLYAILELFSGRKVSLADTSSSNVGTTAVCINGITAFLGILKDSSCETRTEVARIYIVPGRIQFEGKSYFRLTDQLVRPEDRPPLTSSEKQAISQAILNTGDTYVKRTLSLREGSMDLQCLLKFISEQRRSLLVGLSGFASFLGRRRGLVPCKYRSKQRCPRLSEAWSWEKTHLGDTLTELRVNDTFVQFITPSSSHQALAIMAFLINLDVEYFTYIMDEECQDCCLRYANFANRIVKGIFFFIWIK